MNGRSGIFTFFLFLLLALIILLQILSMVQSDRLYERLNMLLDRLKSSGPAKIVQEQERSADLPRGSYPGDKGDWLIWRIGAEPATLNPVTAKDIYAGWISDGNIFETLSGVKVRAILQTQEPFLPLAPDAIFRCSMISTLRPPFDKK